MPMSNSLPSARAGMVRYAPMIRYIETYTGMILRTYNRQSGAQ